MGTTDAKPGFRLPWSADRSEAGDQVKGPVETTVTTDDAPDETAETEMPTVRPESTSEETTVTEPATVESATPEASAPADAAPTEAHAATPPARKPNKFMADLTKAMQVAAGSARDERLAKFGADAQARIEKIQSNTSTEADDIRKKADEDVAGIRDWSKAEIARIREEADERISRRKAQLDQEVESHAAGIDSRVEHVRRRVAAFEAEMTTFFERLFAEEDPTRFAALAESLPDAPSFDDDDAWEASEPEVTSEATVAVSDEAPADTAATTELESAQPVEAADAGWTDGYVDPLIDATATTPDADAPEGATDLAAAEAEAADYTDDGSAAETDVPILADDALAARLAGLVPEAGSGSGDAVSTNVVVTGLITVASIAGFKRHLSRLPGVASVGVTSGPDGEFVFAVAHDAGLLLGDAITTLPGFGARVTGDREGELAVSARDPEADS